jgi:hypothetical protein
MVGIADVSGSYLLWQQLNKPWSQGAMHGTTYPHFNTPSLSISCTIIINKCRCAEERSLVLI